MHIHSIHVDTTYISFLISAVLPMITALITKRYAKGWVKTLTLVVLSVIAGIGEQMMSNGGVFRLDAAGFYMIGTLLFAALVHFGVLKPINLTGANGFIARAVPQGLGPDKPVVLLTESMMVRSTPEHRVVAGPPVGRHAAPVVPPPANPPKV